MKKLLKDRLDEIARRLAEEQRLAREKQEAEEEAERRARRAPRCIADRKSGKLTIFCSSKVVPPVRIHIYLVPDLLVINYNDFYYNY